MKTDSVHIIEVGGKCNNRCLFCPIPQHGAERSFEDLAQELVGALARGASAFRFSGGELTVRKDFGRILALLSRLKRPWILETNGRVLSLPGVARKFALAGLTKAVVSLHGPKEVHNRVVHAEAFDQTIDGIRKLTEAGVAVSIRTVLTPLLVEEVEAGMFVSLIRSLLPNPNLEVVAPPISIGTGAPQEGSLLGRPRPEPSPEDLLDLQHTVRFVSGLLVPGVHLTVRGVPHCLLSIPMRTSSLPAQRRAWVCSTCELNDRCPGFVPGVWRVGGIDHLRPQSRSAPGHLILYKVRTLKNLDIEACPYRRAGARLPGGPESAILLEKGKATLYKPAGHCSAASVFLHAKLSHGQVWLAGSNPSPLYLAPQCRDCYKLHRCPGCFVVGDQAAQPPEVPEFDSTTAVSRRLHPNDDDYFGMVLNSAQRGPVLIREPVREVWLVPDGKPVPVRPQPSDPAVVLRALRSRGLVPISYCIPAEDRRSFFEAVVTVADRVPTPLYARHHEGMSLQVTESCMCRCVMCNLVGYFKRPHMPLREVLCAIEEAALNGIRLLDLFGGEVTLRRDLFDLIAHVRWFSMKCMLITAGYYVTRGYARRLKEAGINRVVVSIDGSRPEIHDSVRQLPGMWDKAIRALRVLANTEGVEVYASTVILTENLQDLPELVRLSGHLGIRKHEFFLPISGPVSSTTPRWPNRAQAEELLDRIIPALEKEAEKYGVRVDFRPEIRSWDVPRATKVELISSGYYNVHLNDPGTRCNAAGFNLFVTVNGNVYPCDMPALISRETALGNLSQGTLLDIVTSPAMAEFDRNAGHHPACRMCVGRYEAVVQ